MYPSQELNNLTLIVQQSIQPPPLTMFWRKKELIFDTKVEAAKQQIPNLSREESRQLTIKHYQEAAQSNNISFRVQRPFQLAYYYVQLRKTMRRGKCTQEQHNQSWIELIEDYAHGYEVLSHGKPWRLYSDDKPYVFFCWNGEHGCRRLFEMPAGKLKDPDVVRGVVSLCMDCISPAERDEFFDVGDEPKFE